MNKIQSIFFDLDGTLVHTGPDLLKSLNYLLIKNQLPKVSLDLIDDLVGGGAQQMIQKGFNFFNKQIKDSEMELLVNDFLVYYEQNCSVKSLPYEGVIKTLEKMNSLKIKLYVCTNKKQYLAEKVLKELKLSKFFCYILGSRPSLKLKPNVEMLNYLVKRTNCSVENILMIGDSINDIQPSHQLGIRSVYVKYGYGKLKNLKPNYQVESFDQILNLI